MGLAWVFGVWQPGWRIAGQVVVGTYFLLFVPLLWVVLNVTPELNLNISSLVDSPCAEFFMLLVKQYAGNGGLHRRLYLLELLCHA